MREEDSSIFSIVPRFDEDKQIVFKLRLVGEKSTSTRKSRKSNKKDKLIKKSGENAVEEADQGQEELDEAKDDPSEEYSNQVKE